MFPAGYSGSQVLRFALKDGPEQRLYNAGNAGLYGHGNLGAYITGYKWHSAYANFGASMSGHNPANLVASIIGAYCQALGPRKYLIGYEDGIPKFVEARQQFRCVDFLSAYIKSRVQSTENLPAAIQAWYSSYADLGGFIVAGKEIFSGQADLGGIIKPAYTTSNNLMTSIAGVYCHLIAPRKYLVGYEAGQPKFIVGRPRYRCVDFLPAYIKHIYSADLRAIIGVRPHEHKDLPATINAILKQGEFGLRGIIRGWGEGYGDLQGIISGMVYEDLLALINALTYKDLPASVYGIPPVDLPAYLNVWPQEDLPANLHGWEYRDLGATIGWFDSSNLGAYIGTSFPRNLRALIKGWVREATSDLGAYIDGFTYEELQGIIRATYLEDLPGYLYCIQPADLNGLIHGWQESDLGASIIGRYGPYDLRGHMGGHLPGDLPATIIADGWTLPYYKNLQGLIYGASILAQQSDLAAYIAIHAPANLPATITAAGGIGNLPAFIYPKTIYMTGIISVATMEHSDLSAVINFICRSSGYLDLSASIRCRYLANLVATITGYKIPTYYADLGAKIGYTDSYVFKDKLPITINIGSGYQIEDKIPISLRIFKQQAYLGGYIVGEYRHSDMPASITATWLEEYSFDNTKSREIVYDLNHARQVNWYEVVEMYFKSMVPEYFYVGAGSSVYKTNRLDRWVLDISSYIPEGMALNIRRKLHRVKNLYDLTDFNTLDEAIRFAIDYVTSYNYGNLGAYLNVIPKIYHTADLPVRIRWFTPTNDDLSATITPQEKTFVLGFDDKVEFI